MQRPEDARKLFDRLHALRPSSWALLGIARAQVALGDAGGARRSLAEVLSLDPACADAHDLQGRLFVEQGDFEAALAEYRAAAEMTSGCLLRTQHAGALAFYQGHKADARRWLEQSYGLGVQSKLFDALSLLLLAMLRSDDGDRAGVVAAGEQLHRYHERFPDSLRLRRLDEAAAWLIQYQNGDAAAAATALTALSAQAEHDDFDLEAANVLLSLWSRLPDAMRAESAHLGTVQLIGERFCIAKATAEVLAAAAQRSEPALGIIRRCQADVAALAEAAILQSMNGQPAAAASQLLVEGERTRNAKLLEMATAIARRHAKVLPEAPEVIERASRCLQSSCRVATHIAGIQRSGRAPGALQLRSRAAG